MLLKISVKNFKSIKEKVTLSMVPAKSNYLSNNIINTGINKEPRLLKTISLYGSNASGKTTVLEAFKYLKYIITETINFQESDKLYYNPFKLSENTKNEPTEISVEFFHKGKLLNYEIKLNEDRILYENLLIDNKEIFERKEEFIPGIDHKKQKQIYEFTKKNIPYLSRASNHNFKKAELAYEWFDKKLGPIIMTEFFERPMRKKDAIKNYKESDKEEILNLLKSADIKIKDIKKVTKEVKHPEKDETLEVKQIKTYHKNDSKELVEFDLEKDESKGTSELFSLVSLFLDAIKNSRILIIDEFENSLHPFLQTFLINLFQDSSNSKSQLIFSTHNVLFLDQDLFRKDQIYFTDKEKGYTDLFSLNEFKDERHDRAYLKKYLIGKYGALPKTVSRFIMNEKTD
ncbi:MAG: AAA family ATPase [Candidatus Woesearchaeota archaeon]